MIKTSRTIATLFAAALLTAWVPTGLSAMIAEAPSGLSAPAGERVHQSAPACERVPPPTKC